MTSSTQPVKDQDRPRGFGSSSPRQPIKPGDRRGGGCAQPLRAVAGPHEEAVRSANLAIKFGLELAALASFAYWGSTLPGAALSAIIAVSAPVAMIVLWGTFAAPRARRRLSRDTRIPFELTVFALAAGALLASGEPALAVAFATSVAVNSILLTAFDQWER